MNYIVYTDGSAYTGDRSGGYAWLIVDENDVEETGGGYEVDTTISRMELMAVISALTKIMLLEDQQEHGSVVLVYSDSEYVVKGFMDKSRKRLKNVDLWDVLENLASWFELVHLEHIKGHAGHADNEAVDNLAGEFRQKAVEQIKNDRTSP